MLAFVKRHKLSILAAIGILSGTAAYAQYSRTATDQNLEYYTVQKDTISETITASGTVDAAEKATLRFQTSGRLAWVGVSEGDQVRKGEALASLDRRELEQNLQKELNDYLNERWDFEQEREDYSIEGELEENIINDELQRILEKSQFDLNNAVIDVEIKDLALRFASLTSPIDGIVTNIDQPYAGVNITPAGAEFTVVNPDSIEFAAEVDETDISKISIGQNVTITLDAYSEEPLVSSVRFIDFESTQTQGGGTAYLVKMHLPDNGNMRFRLGMNGDAEFSIADKTGAIVIPQTAITAKEGQPAVWLIADDGTVHLQEIRLGTETIESAEIIGGLKEGERIIQSGFEVLEEGQQI